MSKCVADYESHCLRKQVPSFIIHSILVKFKCLIYVKRLEQLVMWALYKYTIISIIVYARYKGLCETHLCWPLVTPQKSC